MGLSVSRTAAGEAGPAGQQLPRTVRQAGMLTPEQRGQPGGADHRHAAQAGSSSHLVAPPPLPGQTIRITGLNDTLPVHRA